VKRHKDLLAILRHQGMRVTPARKMLLQFFLDNQHRQIPLKDIYTFMKKNLPKINPSSIYRNLEVFKEVEIIQALNLPKTKKQFQYIFDRKVHHYYICKACGKLNRGNHMLFKKIESALREIHDFKKANLSVIFYGRCQKCTCSNS
jgi:Fur family transcriptional regulator, ferric uptake regulator